MTYRGSLHFLINLKTIKFSVCTHNVAHWIYSITTTLMLKKCFNQLSLSLVVTVFVNDFSLMKGISFNNKRFLVIMNVCFLILNFIEQKKKELED